MCQRAGLLIAFDKNTHRALVTRANCDSWNCPECKQRMSDRWGMRAIIGARQIIASGDPLDFVTITGHEKLKTFEATEAVWRSAWSKLYAAVKRKQPSLMYFIVPEKHKDGRMHVHALWNAGVSQRWLKDNARRRGLGYQAKIIHLTEGGKAARYVCKYIGKGLGDDVPAHFRRVRVSQNWADIPEPENAMSALSWEYVNSNGALEVIYRECKAKGYDLIDIRTGEYFDDIDLETITEFETYAQ